jgi:large subunit ribosomal protein L19
LFELVESKYRRGTELAFAVGDTVVVTLKIAEGDKERLQDFEGVVIARRGRALDEMFTVRRLVGDEGVERVFPLHSPKIASIKVRRSGKVRRSKLYFLRDRVGKARKLRERRVSAEAKQQSEAARRAKQEALAEADRVVARAGESGRKTELAAT